jgi:RHS repeat-associated protein
VSFLPDRATNVTYTAENGSLIRSLEYGYNAASMITNKTIVDGAASSVAYAYEYDSIDRLVGETTSSGVDIQYAYDLAGNRTSVVENGVTNSYTLGIGNRLSSWGTNGSARYDTAGNTTNLVSNNGTELDLKWDERYRLVNVDVGSLPSGQNGSAASSVAYAYDVLGRRTSRFVVPPLGGPAVEEEHYIYQGNQIVADVDASGNLLRSYTYGPGIDNLLSMTVYTNGGAQASATYYYLKDHQNTVLALTDESGSVVESYAYDAYGRILSVKDGSGVPQASSIGSPVSALGNRYTFQGREIDWTTGLMYFRARWYNPETGRWLSKDPIRIAGGLNLYAFCDNNPVNFVDPMGLCGEDDDIPEWLQKILDEIQVARDELKAARDALNDKGIDRDKIPGWKSNKGITFSRDIGGGWTGTIGVGTGRGGSVGVGVSRTW